MADRDTDRLLGYGVLAFLALFVGSFLAYTVVVTLHPADVRQVLFDRISNVRIEDPVKARGLTVGRISAIELRGAGALVTIDFQRRMDIRRDYRIMAIDRGVMGDRMIVIDYGSDTAPALSPGDTLAGTSSFGIAEIIGSAWRMRELVERYARLADLVLHGDGNRRSMVAAFTDAMTYADSATNQVTRVTQAFERVIATELPAIRRLVDSSAVTVDSLAATAQRYSTDLRRRMEHLSGLTASLSRVIDQLGPVVKAVDTPDCPLWQTHLMELQRRIDALNLLIREMRSGLAELPVNL